MSRESESNKESIQVTIRVRPPKDKELNEDPRVCVRVDKDSHTLVLQTGGTNADSKAFTFDSICDYSDSQKDIFEKVGINSTQRCLEGTSSLTQDTTAAFSPTVRRAPARPSR